MQYPISSMSWHLQICAQCWLWITNCASGCALCWPRTTRGGYCYHHPSPPSLLALLALYHWHAPKLSPSLSPALSLYHSYTWSKGSPTSCTSTGWRNKQEQILHCQWLQHCLGYFASINAVSLSHMHGGLKMNNPASLDNDSKASVRLRLDPEQ